MKQIFTLLVVLSFSLLAHGQTFKNKPLLSKRTADWCPTCGSWGWEFKQAMLEQISSEDATIVALHHSGGLANPTSIAITEAMGGFSQPKFYFNNTDVGAGGSTWESRLEDMKVNVAEMNLEIPVFGIELHGYPGASANELVAEINLHVNQAVEGEFYLGTYLITNNLIHTQSGSVAGGADASHKKILLDEFSGEPFGRLIGNGPILEGVLNFDITTTFDNVPAESTDIAVIIWQIDGENYNIINTGVVEGVELLSGNDEVNWIKNASAFYANDQINITIDSEETIGEYQVNILDTNGRIVSKNNGNAIKNKLHMQVEVNHLVSGNYFVNVLSSKGLWTEKIIIVK